MLKCCWKSICINWLKIFRKEPFYTLKYKKIKKWHYFFNNAKYGGRTVLEVYLTKNSSVKSGIIFHIEKNIARAYRDAKSAFVCLAVKME